MLYLLVGLSAANLAALLYVIFRAQYAASLPFAQALAQKEAELMVLRQTVVEAQRALAMQRGMIEQMAKERDEPRVARPQG